MGAAFVGGERAAYRELHRLVRSLRARSVIDDFEGLRGENIGPVIGRMSVVGHFHMSNLK